MLKQVMSAPGRPRVTCRGPACPAEVSTQALLKGAGLEASTLPPELNTRRLCTALSMCGVRTVDALLLKANMTSRALRASFIAMNLRSVCPKLVPPPHHAAPTKLAWIHVPGCGTSFGTTLMHYSNSSLPLAVKADTFEPSKTLRSYPAASWFPRFWPLNMQLEPSAAKMVSTFADHRELSEAAYREHEGRLFALFREPVCPPHHEQTPNPEQTG